MGCNENRLNCSPDDIYAANALPGCGRFITPSSLQGEQVVYGKAYEDLINSFGVKVNYYIHTFNLSGADLLYGEHPTAIFYGPINLSMYVEINNEAITLQKFGFDSADEFTGYVSIRAFESVVSSGNLYIQTESGNITSYEITDTPADVTYSLLSSNIDMLNNSALEPKAGDLIEVIAMGCDRPAGRGPKIFEVTQRRDQEISTINPLLGHYVWKIQAKRFDYSFQPNTPQEQQNEQVFENSFSGVISSNVSNDYYNQQPSQNKTYSDDIDVTSKEDVFDLDKNNNDIYGDYY